MDNLFVSLRLLVNLYPQLKEIHYCLLFLVRVLNHLMVTFLAG